MSSFLPASPRRKWHPSEWNIVRVGSAVGATLALGACADDTVAAEDSATQGTTDQTDYSDYQDGYHDGYHDWSDYSDYSDTTDYTDYTDSPDGWDYSDYTDNWDRYWYPECYVDEDCGPNMECVNNYCEPLECTGSDQCDFGEFCDDNNSCVGIDLPTECLAPALQEIPLPTEASGVIVALRFVELDGDPAQELILLRDDAIVVVDGTQATTIAHGGFSLDGIAATDADNDGVLDIVATSSTKLNTRVFQGDGLGGFLAGVPGPAMMLDEAHGIDWPVFGPGELLARTSIDEAVILSSLLQQMPDIDLLETEVDGLAVGDFDGNGRDDVAAVKKGGLQVRLQGGIIQSNDALGPPGTYEIVAGDFDGDPIADIVVLRADASFSVVTVVAPPDEPAFGVGLVGAYQVAHPINFGPTSFALVVQSGPAVEYLYTDDQFSAWCIGDLDELPPVSRLAVGDFDGDGDDELAVVDADGAVTLWGDD